MACRSSLLFNVIFVCLIVVHRSSLAQEQTPATPAVAKAEVDGFIETNDYQRMKQRIAHWSKDMTSGDRKKIIVELSSRLMNTREIELTNYADMFVPSRSSSGRMEFSGHGEMVLQDVFLENGRCAWAIEQMLKCRLTTFSVELNEKPEKLAESVRKSLLKVIDAMALPEKAKVENRP
jgi:hypothetical protein